MVCFFIPGRKEKLGHTGEPSGNSIVTIRTHILVAISNMLGLIQAFAPTDTTAIGTLSNWLAGYSTIYNQIKFDNNAGEISILRTNPMNFRTMYSSMTPAGALGDYAGKAWGGCMHKRYVITTGAMQPGRGNFEELSVKSKKQNCIAGG